MINREEAFILIRKYLKDADNIKYSIAIEAVLREIAKRLDRDEELWGLTGLLHNIDYEYTAAELENRGILSAQLLEGLLPESGVNAIKANNYTHTEQIPTTALDKSLIAVDALTGLILATANSLKMKDIKDITLNELILKFNDEEFATRFNRSRIKLCVDIGIDITTFFKICLNTIKILKEDMVI